MSPTRLLSPFQTIRIAIEVLGSYICLSSGVDVLRELENQLPPCRPCPPYVPSERRHLLHTGAPATQPPGLVFEYWERLVTACQTQAVLDAAASALAESAQVNLTRQLVTQVLRMCNRDHSNLIVAIVVNFDRLISLPPHLRPPLLRAGVCGYNAPLYLAATALITQKMYSDKYYPVSTIAAHLHFNLEAMAKAEVDVLCALGYSAVVPEQTLRQASQMLVAGLHLVATVDARRPAQTNQSSIVLTKTVQTPAPAPPPQMPALACQAPAPPTMPIQRIILPRPSSTAASPDQSDYEYSEQEAQTPRDFASGRLPFMMQRMGQNHPWTAPAPAPVTFTLAQPKAQPQEEPRTDDLESIGAILCEH